MTLAAVAANKGMRVEGMETSVLPSSSDGGDERKGFSIDIDISGDLTERECKILSNTAKRCEISKMLNDRVDIRYQLHFYRGRNSLAVS